jgi:hypothetical protein
MNSDTRNTLVEDLFLPVLLFAALGGMTWAVRGCAGFGAVKGCIFAGVTWGAAWWFIARDPGREQSRRYASGWIILALTIGVGIAGERGWMQWPHFINNRMYIQYPDNFVYIPKAYGFFWMFIAGIPWAGLGACLLAWCASGRTTRAWQWAARIGCGFAGYYLLTFLLARFPGAFLPLYDSLEAQYNDLETNRNLWKVVRDTREGFMHLGLYLGFLVFEIARRDRKNVILILSVGLLNGLGWAGFQVWQWAGAQWPTAGFNWWRCWESAGGVSIGVAYGVAYFLVNRRMTEEERSQQTHNENPTGEWLAVYLGLLLTLAFFVTEELGYWGFAYLSVAAAFGVAYYLKNRAQQGATITHGSEDPNLERLGAYAGILFGLLLSFSNGIRGFAKIYSATPEGEWRTLLWNTFGPLMLVLFIVIALRILLRPLARDAKSDVFPHAYALLWLVIISVNFIAQAITLQPPNWVEMFFSLYYTLLFFITAVIFHHYHRVNRLPRPST